MNLKGKKIKIMSVILILFMLLQNSASLLGYAVQAANATNNTSNTTNTIGNTSTGDIQVPSDEETNQWDVSEAGDGSVTGTLDEKGTLTISGTGKMKSAKWSENGENAGNSTSEGENSNTTNPNTVSDEFLPWHEKRIQIKKVVIEDGITNISKGAFMDLTGLQEITIATTVTNIESEAFRNCSQLKSITIPEGVTSIDDGAFSGCWSLQTINLPSTVTSLSSVYNSNCISLKEVNVAENSTVYSSEDGILYNKDKTGIEWYPDGKEEDTYQIPTTLTSFNMGAVDHNYYLKTLKISSSVTSLNIGPNIIRSASKLEAFQVDENNPNYSSEDGVLFNKDKTELLSYPVEKKSESYKIPDTVTTIGGDAFRGNQYLKEIDLNNGKLEVIKARAFSWMELEQITIPKSVNRLEVIKIEMNGLTMETGPFLTNSCYIDHFNVEEENTTYYSENDIIYTKDESKEEIVRPFHKFLSGKIVDVSEKQDESILAQIDENQTLKITGTGRMKDDLKISCVGIKNIEIGDGITYIGRNAFITPNYNIIDSIYEAIRDIKPLEEPNIKFTDNINVLTTKDIKIGKDVVEINEEVFKMCSNQNYIVKEENQSFSTQEGILVNKDKTELISYPRGREEREYIIPKEIQKIKNNAFIGETKLFSLLSINNRDRLKKVYIPSSVKEIEEKAFNGRSASSELQSCETILLYCQSDTKASEYVKKSDTYYSYVIDDEAPELEVQYESIEQGIVVTITANEEMQLPEGWNYVEGSKKAICKTYAEKDEETVEILDYVGNKASVEVSTKIISRIEYITNIDSDNKILSVTAIIKAPRDIEELPEGWTYEENNKKEILKVYTKDTQEEVIIKDNLGRQESAKIEIVNIGKTIDTQAPNLKVEYITNLDENQKIESIQAIIKADKEIQLPEGWEYVESAENNEQEDDTEEEETKVNKKEITKTYTQDTQEEITVKDFFGNATTINIEVKNIGKTILGDINLDGRVSMIDFLAGLRHIATEKDEKILEEYPDWQLSGTSAMAADVNNDGKINVTDMYKILCHITAEKDDTIREEHPDWIIGNHINESNEEIQGEVLDVGECEIPENDRKNIIASRKQLEDYITQYGTYTYDSQNNKILKEDWRKVLEKYQDDFFQNKSLALVYVPLNVIVPVTYEGSEIKDKVITIKYKIGNDVAGAVPQANSGVLVKVEIDKEITQIM